MTVVKPPQDDDFDGDMPTGHTPYTPLGVDDRKTSKEEMGEVMAQIPLLRDQLKRFDSKIKALENYSNISDATLTNTEKFMHVVAGRKVAVGFIKSERKYLQGRIDKVLSKQ